MERARGGEIASLQLLLLQTVIALSWKEFYSNYIEARKERDSTNNWEKAEFQTYAYDRSIKKVSHKETLIETNK